ncbi:type IV toxin-antitoxin system YeeU family antitoxin [Aeromonas aquatica]|uniref:type IV toxin-antitoxin system YeeU family antitoxin n=1 Tax=Aeromonas aquatica TaxID=558964 RepID=UPI00286FA11D|nr:type IV toxin-antitoxin system YeeU family antitoxin [Aeromonas aquatica]
MTTTHNTFPAAPAEHGSEHQEPAQRAIISWGLPRDISPRFGARLIQCRYRLDFLSDRASLIGEWTEEAIDKLNNAFPAIIKQLEDKLLTGELDAQRQQCITIQHNGFTCEADTLGSHGYVYITIYRAIGANATPSSEM